MTLKLRLLLNLFPDPEPSVHFIRIATLSPMKQHRDCIFRMDQFEFLVHPWARMDGLSSWQESLFLCEPLVTAVCVCECIDMHDT